MGNMDESTIETGVAADVGEAVDTGQVLHERLKEITCLYEIRCGMGLELSVDEVCEQVFEHLVPAMQFPEMASAVIELDGTAFASRNHSGRVTHSLQSPIRVNGKIRGHLQVFYPPESHSWCRKSSGLSTRSRVIWRCGSNARKSTKPCVSD